jgi:hypothetical protein
VTIPKALTITNVVFVNGEEMAVGETYGRDFVERIEWADDGCGVVAFLPNDERVYYPNHRIHAVGLSSR